MAPKSKEKKEKGKKGKHKTEKVRLDATAEVLAPSVAVSKQAAPQQAATAPAAETKGRKAEGESATSTSDAILDAVIDCVANGGIEGLTTRRIAAQAGVNEVTIFRRFGNKDALLDAVFAREAARMKAGAIQYSNNLEVDLVRIVALFREGLVRRAGVLPILYETAQRRPEGRTGAQHPLFAFAEVTGVLERYMNEGKLRREPAQQTLAALVGPLVFGALPTNGSDRRGEVDAQQHVRAFLFGRAIA